MKNLPVSVQRDVKSALAYLEDSHHVLEWGIDEGVRKVLARLYKGTKRTSAYIPMPCGVWPESIPGEVYRKAQEMYAEDDAKPF